MGKYNLKFKDIAIRLLKQLKRLFRKTLIAEVRLVPAFVFIRKTKTSLIFGAVTVMRNGSKHGQKIPLLL